MCRLGKRYKQNGMYDGPPRIVEKTHPNKEATTKAITTYTSQILSDKSNPQTTQNMNLGAPKSLMCVYLQQNKKRAKAEGKKDAYFFCGR